MNKETHSPKFSTRKKLLFGLGPILILGIIFAFFNQKEKLANPKRGPIVEAIYGIGTVTARKKFSFKVGQVKTVQKLLVQEGDFVEKDKPLIDLSDGVRVKAPFQGTVTSLPFNAGENVFQDVAVVTMEDLSDRYVTATLEQQGALRVKKGMRVTLNFESFRERNFTGVVESIYPQKGQFIVRIEIAGLPKEVLPGMTADASIEVATKENALLVPLLSVSNGKINVKRGHQKKTIDVKIGSMDNEWAEIISGDLQLDDQIILNR